MPYRNTPTSATRYRGGFHDMLNNVLEAYYNSTLFLRASTTALTTPLSLQSTSATGGIGYATGAGSTVTQITNRSTGVTINAICGAITTDATSLAAGVEATFTVTNSAVAIGDTVVLSARSGQTAATSVPIVTAVASGSFYITLTNLHASTADTGAMIINFAVIKAVSA